MNPLQKKCVLATAGFHLLLLAILFLGPALRPEPKTDSLPVLKTVSLDVIEAAQTSGTAAVTPPSANQLPAQPVQQPVTPTPLPPEPPKPVVTPPVEPTPTPAQPEVTKPVEPKPDDVKPTEPAEPDDTKPDEQPDPIQKPKPKPPHKVVAVLDEVTPATPTTLPKHPHRDTSKADQEAADARAEEKAARDAAHRRAIAFRNAATSFDEGLSHSTDVKPVGSSSVATANYGQIVKSIYYNAWVLPSSAANDESSPVVRVVIARDGSVISAHIIEPSGDATVDDSVQRALDSVSSIQPFAESATEKQRAYTIKFDLKTKRML